MLDVTRKRKKKNTQRAKYQKQQKEFICCESYVKINFQRETKSGLDVITVYVKSEGDFIA